MSHRHLPPRFRLIRAACTALLLAGLAACGGPDKAPGAAEAKAETKKNHQKVPVETATVSRRSIAARYSGTASLSAAAEAEVVAKTSGVLIELLAEEGDAVKAGQVLARLDPDRKGLALAQQKATLEKLEREYKRSTEMFQRQLVSADAHEKIRSELEIQRAAVDIAELELSYTRVVAPISGVIAQRMAKEGNLIQANGPLFKIVDTSRLEAVLNVPERELATLKAGLPVSMQCDAVPGRDFAGRIDRISPVVDAGSGTFRVTATFTEQPALRPGMFGRIGVVYDQREDALTVPRDALLEGEGEPAVFAVREGKAVRVPVELGYQDGSLAEIRAGLAEGEQVVTVGKVALRAGAEVEVVNAPALAEDKSGEQAEPGTPAGNSQAAAQ